jgi:hypothetical protein
MKNDSPAALVTYIATPSMLIVEHKAQQPRYGRPTRRAGWWEGRRAEGGGLGLSDQQGGASLGGGVAD